MSAEVVSTRGNLTFSFENSSFTCENVIFACEKPVLCHDLMKDLILIHF